MQTKKKGDSIVSDCFRGVVRVKTTPIIDKETVIDDPFAPQESGNGHFLHVIFPNNDLDVQTPFFFLALELPEAPLYQDELERNIIPQVRKCQGSYL